MSGNGYSNNSKIQIVLINGSQLLREMLMRVFHKVPDFEIAGNTKDLAGLRKLLSSNRTDWLVITTSVDNSASATMENLRRSYPEMHILVIANDGSEVLARITERKTIHMEKASLPELITLMREQSNPVSG